MRYLIALFLTLSACGDSKGIDQSKILYEEGRETIRTKCGATFNQVWPSWDVQKTEDELLEIYSGIFPRAEMCAALEGAFIYFRNDSDGYSFLTDDGRQVKGDYDFDTNSIELADTPPIYSFLVHEIGHLWEYKIEDAWRRDVSVCEPLASMGVKTAGCGDAHFRWAERGFASIEETWFKAHKGL